MLIPALRSLPSFKPISSISLRNLHALHFFFRSLNFIPELFHFLSVLLAAMEITTLYQKQRREFGRPCNHFSSTEVALLDPFVVDDRARDLFVERNPSVLEIQAIPEMSEHEVRALASGCGLSAAAFTWFEPACCRTCR